METHTRLTHTCPDTLDLQDQDAPSAAEHHKTHATNGHNGVAPHQAAQLHHVIEERHSEEQSLADAWHLAGDLTEEPGAMGEARASHEGEHVSNGQRQDGEEGAEGAEGDGEGDDDMMDRISSSPSIDDGGFLSSSPSPFNTSTSTSTRSPAAAQLRSWPLRSTSLSPVPSVAGTPTREDFNTSTCSTADSSPFLHTPQHWPRRRWSGEKEASPLSRAIG